MKINKPVSQDRPQIKRIEIQYLRALAVCIVVIFHARQEYLPNGYLGVDLFFIISGFVLTPKLVTIYSSHKNDVSTEVYSFFVRRFNRLIPAFLFSLSITIPVLLIFQSINKIHETLQQVLLSLLFLGNFGAESLVGNYFSPKPNPYLHFWSLSAEWQIYFFIPALFLAIRHFTRRYSPNLKLILIFITVSSLFLNFINAGTDSLIGYYSPLTRIWQFSIGALSYLYLNGGHVGIAIKRLARVILTLSTLNLFSPHELSRFAGELTVVSIFLSLVVSQLSMSNRLGNILSWIGDRSYSIYLFHMPLLYVAIHSPISGTNEFSRAMGVIIATLTTFLLATVCYTQVETRQSDAFSESKKYPRIYFLIFLICSLGVWYSAIPGPFQSSEKTTVAWNTSDRCMDGAQRNCVIIEPESYKSTVLVIGDSHAQHFFSSLRSFGFSNQIKFVYSTTYSESDVEKIRPAIVLFSKFHQSVDETSLRMFTEEMKRIRKSGAQILYVGDNPVFLDYLKYSHFINPSFLSKFLSQIGFTDSPLSEVSIRNLDQDALLAGQKYLEAAREYSLTIDPFDMVCDGNSCFRRNSTGWLYWDDHHFSELGAALVSNSIETTILRVLKNE